MRVLSTPVPSLVSPLLANNAIAQGISNKKQRAKQRTQLDEKKNEDLEAKKPSRTIQGTAGCHVNNLLEAATMLSSTRWQLTLPRHVTERAAASIAAAMASAKPTSPECTQVIVGLRHSQPDDNTKCESK